jgi:hypothetical protein
MTEVAEATRLNMVALQERTERWRMGLGLDSPIDVPPGHDEAHVLVREFLGRGFQKVPTVLEEIVVECIEEGSRFKTREISRSFFQGKSDTAYKRNLEEEIRRSLKISLSLGVLSEKFLPPERTNIFVGRVLRLFKSLSNRKDFYLLLRDVKEMKRFTKMSS